MARNRNAAGFTLIELLVVIAIISLLVSILLPSLERARALAERVVCMTNVKQIALGFVFYVEDNEGFLPPGYMWPRNGYASNWSWFDFLATVTDIQAGRGVLVCPSDEVVYATHGSYRANYGSWDPNTFFYFNSATQFRAFHYDNVNDPFGTLALVESDAGTVYVNVGPWPSLGWLDPLTAVDERHLDGANYLWFDWHVTFEPDVPIPVGTYWHN